MSTNLNINLFKKSITKQKNKSYNFSSTSIDSFNIPNYKLNYNKETINKSKNNIKNIKNSVLSVVREELHKRLDTIKKENFHKLYEIENDQHEDKKKSELLKKSSFYKKKKSQSISLNKENINSNQIPNLKHLVMRKTNDREYSDFESSFLNLSKKLNSSSSNITQENKLNSSNIIKFSRVINKEHPLVTLYDKLSKEIPSKETSVNTYRNIQRGSFQRRRSQNIINMEYLPNKNLVKRWKTYEIEIKKDYFIQLGINKFSYSKIVIEDSDFQVNIINDEIIIIIEGIYSIKSKFLSNNEVLFMFRTLSHSIQVKINKHIETIIGLLLSISQVILSEFTSYLEKFIMLKPINPIRLTSFYVNNEVQVFTNNISLFDELIYYFKTSKNAYFLLIKSNSNFLPFSEFKKLSQLMDRCRNECSEVLFLLEELTVNYSEDKRLLEKLINKKSTKENKLNPNHNRVSIKKIKLQKLNEIVPIKKDKTKEDQSKERKSVKINKYNDKSKYISVINSKQLHNLGRCINKSAKHLIFSFRIKNRYDNLLNDQ